AQRPPREFWKRQRQLKLDCPWRRKRADSWRANYRDRPTPARVLKWTTQDLVPHIRCSAASAIDEIRTTRLEPPEAQKNTTRFSRFHIQLRHLTPVDALMSAHILSVHVRYQRACARSRAEARLRGTAHPLAARGAPPARIRPQ